MSLKSKIEKEIKDSMLKKNKDRLLALRSIKSMILLAESEKGAGGGITEENELKILTKAAKQRKDSLEIYQQQGRKDLAEKELDELKVIEEFLPRQMDEEELSKAIAEIISSLGASGLSDMGKVMGAATKSLAGKADGKAISGVVRKMLGS